MCNIIINYFKAELIFVLVQLLFVFKEITYVQPSGHIVGAKCS